MASPSHVAATEGYFRYMGRSKALPEAAQGKGYFSSLIRGQLKLDDSQHGRVSLTFTVKPAFAVESSSSKPPPKSTVVILQVPCLIPSVDWCCRILTTRFTAVLWRRWRSSCAKTVIADRELFLGEFNTSYLAAARLNQEMEIVGTTLRQGRSVTVIAVEFKVKETGKLHYITRLTYYRMPGANL